MDLVDLFGIVQTEEEKKYTQKVGIPQYLPSAECPRINELYDDRKYKELMEHIYNSDLSDDLKDFLRLAATRHIGFNYAKIADYYAHASKEVQRLMEESALVIIDVNDAIANGYVKFSEKIDKIMSETGRLANEEYSNQARDTRKQ